MITTRESINYQFSLIFGYSSPKDIIVGNSIGPGKLTIERLNQLSEDVLKFLRMYNAILRDFTGSEVFSIEFELSNLDEKDSRISIYPKSMILIPGRFKDSEGLLLALKPETGYLDIHKSKTSVDHVCELFFEVEEFTEHPNLDNLNKFKILNKFAIRFSKKLFSELIGDKWNKKLIGVNYSLPTEESLLNTYGSIKSDVSYIWNRRPVELNLSNHDFKPIPTPFEGMSEIEHLKYLISEPSSIFIVEKTLKLGSDLLKLANTGTVDAIQEKITLFMINQINIKLRNLQEKVSINVISVHIKNCLNDLKCYYEKIEHVSKNFAYTGEFGQLSVLIDRYNAFLKDELANSNVIYDEIIGLINYSLNLSIDNHIKIRAIDLSSGFNFFFEVCNQIIKKLENSLPKYLSRKRLNDITNNFLKILYEKFNLEQEPSKTLGCKILERFGVFLSNQIENHPLIKSNTSDFDEELIKKEFKKLILSNVNPFFEKIELTIEDLVSFAETQMEKNHSNVENHLKKFRKFSAELNFLFNYILRYSTINRFLKEESEKEVVDPVMFINKFHRFLERRFGGINLEWNEYILEWLIDYSKQFFKMDKKVWNIKETISDLIRYLDSRKTMEVKTENFSYFLDKYISKINDGQIKYALMDFYKYYEFSIDIKKEFPKYVREMIEKEIDTFIIADESLTPADFLKENGENNYYDYIKEYELKYFSKLIPKPISLILRHSFTDDEKELFNGDLFHVLKFKYWYNKCAFEISDNFKEVYRDWLRKAK